MLGGEKAGEGPRGLVIGPPKNRQRKRKALKAGRGGSQGGGVRQTGGLDGLPWDVENKGRKSGGISLRPDAWGPFG